MTKSGFIPLESHEEYSTEEMTKRAAEFLANLQRRRTVRQFSEKPVTKEIIEQCIRAAGCAPSGANKQPWHFVVVSDAVRKKRIREAAEAEEREFYSRRAPQAWLEVLAPLGTDENKPFLETAPYLIVIFEQRYEINQRGERVKHYYTQESVGIAVGMLITAIHNAGLVSLTHTPSPMGFLNDILDRPAYERPFLILVVGHPSKDAVVPKLERKSLDQIVTFL
ncbi:MAG: nitroreductase family protein [Candidatus Krumholzibacteria bacterium]|nr:nitroreductase family protein [Candidatus Krumholzibacteria bacterium]